MLSSKPKSGYIGRGLQSQTWAVIGGIVLALHFLPVAFPNAMDVVIMIYLYAIISQGWNVLSGYEGPFSFGHTAFFGVGAYVSTLLFTHLGLSPWFGILFSCAAGVLLGLIIGFLCFRYGLEGPFFALSMLGFAEILHVIALGWNAVGGAVGILIPLKGNSFALMQFISKEPFYFITLWIMLGSLYFVWRLQRTRIGHYFLAVREDQAAAEALGVNTFKVKMIAIAISGGMTAIGGTIYAQYLLYIDPDSTFGLSNSV